MGKKQKKSAKTKVNPVDVDAAPAGVPADSLVSSSTPSAADEETTKLKIRNSDKKPKSSKKKRRHSGDVKADSSAPPGSTATPVPSQSPAPPSRSPAPAPRSLDAMLSSAPVGKRRKMDKSSGNALQEALEYIHRLVMRRDTNDFFSSPVNDMIAPGYSAIISDPMDLSTIKDKINAGVYCTLAEYKTDLKLVCTNAMEYNHPDTVFYKAAQKFLEYVLRTLCQEKLLGWRRSGLAVIVQLPEDLLYMGPSSMDWGEKEGGSGGADGGGGGSSSTVEKAGAGIVEKSVVREESVEQYLAPPRKLVKNRVKNKYLHFEAIPDNLPPKDILALAQEAAEDAATSLQEAHGDPTVMAFGKAEDGRVMLNIVNPDNDGVVDEKHRVRTLGEKAGALTAGTAALYSLREEDSKLASNMALAIQYLNYDGYSSNGPTYDSSFANLSKEESDLLYQAYGGDNTAFEYAKSMRDFAGDSVSSLMERVDSLLDSLTGGKHSKARKQIQEDRDKKLEVAAEALREVDRQQQQKQAETIPIASSTAAGDKTTTGAGDKTTTSGDKTTTGGDKTATDSDKTTTGGDKTTTDGDKADPPQPPTESVSTEAPADTVDFDQLRSLSDLGIDIGFLSEYEESYKASLKLRASEKALRQLHSAQNARLNQKPPANLWNVQEPSDEEKKLGTKAIKALSSSVKEAAPGDLISREDVRAAMGGAPPPGAVSLEEKEKKCGKEKDGESGEKESPEKEGEQERERESVETDQVEKESDRENNGESKGKEQGESRPDPKSTTLERDSDNAKEVADKDVVTSGDNDSVPSLAKESTSTSDVSSMEVGGEASVGYVVKGDGQQSK